MRYLYLIITLGWVFNVYGQNAYYETIQLYDLEDKSFFKKLESNSFKNEGELISIGKWIKFYHNPFDSTVTLRDKDIQTLFNMDTLSINSSPVTSEFVLSELRRRHQLKDSKTDEIDAFGQWLERPLSSLSKLKDINFNILEGSINQGPLNRISKSNHDPMPIPTKLIELGVIYLEDQFRDDIVRNYFKSIHNYFNKDTLLRTLFPGINDELVLLKNEDIPTLKKSFRSTINKDFHDIANNTLTYLEDHLDSNNSHKYDIRLLNIINTGVQLLHSGYNPNEVFEKLKLKFEDANENADVAVNLLYYFSKNVLSKNPNEYFIGSQDFAQINGKIKISLFNGLLYQEIMRDQTLLASSPNVFSHYPQKYREIHQVYTRLLLKLRA